MTSSTMQLEFGAIKSPGKRRYCRRASGVEGSNPSSCNHYLPNVMGKQMRKIKTVDEWCDSLGLKSPDFSGADSYVWLRGDNVIKLTYVSRCDIPYFREVVRANFSGCPVAQIKSCRPVGPCIMPWGSRIGALFKVIQERVPTEQIFGHKNRGCKTPDELPPIEWTDCEGNMWYQGDDIPSNASSDGRWLDFGAIYLVRINPYKERFRV